VDHDPLAERGGEVVQIVVGVERVPDLEEGAAAARAHTPQPSVVPPFWLSAPIVRQHSGSDSNRSQ